MRAHDRDKEAQRSPWQSGAAALCNVGVGVSGTYAGIAAASWWQKAGPRQRLLAFGVATGYSGMLAYYVNSYTAGQAEQVRQVSPDRGHLDFINRCFPFAA